MGQSIRAAPAVPRQPVSGAGWIQWHWHDGHPDGPGFWRPRRTTAGSDEKCSFCLSLGAEIAVNYRGDWATALAEWAQPHGIDAILDMIGGDYFPTHIRLLASGGRLVHIATSHGSQVSLDLRAMMTKRLTGHGFHAALTPGRGEVCAWRGRWSRKCGHCSLTDRFVRSSIPHFHWNRQPMPTGSWSQAGHMGKIVLVMQ